MLQQRLQLGHVRRGSVRPRGRRMQPWERLLRRVVHEQRVRRADMRGGQQRLHGEHGVLQSQLPRRQMHWSHLHVERVGLLDGERVLYRAVHRREVRSPDCIRVKRE